MFKLAHFEDQDEGAQWYFPVFSHTNYIIKWVPNQASVDDEVITFELLKKVLASYLPSQITKDIRVLAQGHTYTIHSIGPLLEYSTKHEMMIYVIEELILLLMHALRMAVILTRNGYKMTKLAVLCIRGSSVHILPELIEFDGILWYDIMADPNPEQLMNSIMNANLLSILNENMWNLDTLGEGMGDDLYTVVERQLNILRTTRDSHRFLHVVRAELKRIMALSEHKHKPSFENSLERASKDAVPG